jgi:hypothetical protein
MRNEEQGWTTVADADEEEGGTDHLRCRERRGREKEGGVSLSHAPSLLVPLKATRRTTNEPLVVSQQSV